MFDTPTYKSCISLSINMSVSIWYISFNYNTSMFLCTHNTTQPVVVIGVINLLFPIYRYHISKRQLRGIRIVQINALKGIHIILNV